MLNITVQFKENAVQMQCNQNKNARPDKLERALH
jgi:hypothetical protein